MQCPGKQDVILEVHVRHDVGLQLLTAQEKRTPAGAGLGWGHEVACELPQVLQIRAVLLVLKLHLASRSHEVPPLSARNGREQDYLLLLHVQLERLLHAQQVRCQTARDRALVGVHPLDLPCQLDEVSQFTSVRVVEVNQDVFDQLGQRPQIPVDDGLCVIGFDLAQNRAGVDPARRTRVGDRPLTSATEVEFVLPEDTARRWVPERYVC